MLIYHAGGAVTSSMTSQDITFRSSEAAVRQTLSANSKSKEVLAPLRAVISEVMHACLIHF